MTTVKIVCSCGTKFAFEADETVTLATGVIQCPGCGSDAASAANAQLLAARATIVTVTETDSTEPDPQPEPVETSAAPRKRHVPFAQARKPTRSERQIRQNRAEAARRRPYFIAAQALLALLLSFWAWYKFIASKPKTVMQAEYSRAERPLVQRFLENQQMLVIRNRDVSLINVPGGEVIWQKSLGSVTNADDIIPNHMEVDTYVERPTPAVRITPNGFWIIWPDHVWNLSRDSGEEMASLELADAFTPLLAGENLLLIETQASATNKLAFDVFPLAGGKPSPIELDLTLTNEPPELVPDGNTVVAIQTRLLESRIITNKLSTGPKVMTASGIEKSVDDNFDKILENTHTAGQSLEAAATLVEELNRRGEAALPDELYEDRSLYEVEIRRVHGGSSTWKGQVTGRPVFFPLNSVDVVAGDTAFKVIDKSGRQKWEAPLSYPLSEEAQFAAEFFQPTYGTGEPDDQNGLRAYFPFVERDGRLYAYDQGVLAAFDLETGEVKWRVTSVGIRRIVFDRAGDLYACTTQDGPQTLKNKKPFRKDDPVHEIIKVDPKSGTVLWHAPHLGTDLFVSGKFLYSQWVGVNVLDRAAALAAASDVVPSCAITRIDPGSGEVLWRREYRGVPNTINVRDTSVMVQFSKRMEILKFFSL